MANLAVESGLLRLKAWAKNACWLICDGLLSGLFVYAVVPAVIMPSGVWRRQIVRENPLRHPIAVEAVDRGEILAGGKIYRLAGLSLPNDPVLAAEIDEAIRVFTAQGIEVIREVDAGGAALLRCEPRIFHWCGTDPVAAHYQQCNLNQLLLLCGWAVFDPGASGLTAQESRRLQGAERYASDFGKGVWEGGSRNIAVPVSKETGLNISYAPRVPDELLDFLGSVPPSRRAEASGYTH